MVTDEVLDTVVPTAPYRELPAVLVERVGNLGSGILLSPPEDPAHDDEFGRVIAELKATSP